MTLLGKNTLLIERSEVRALIMACLNLDSEATAELLADIDRLPIYAPADFLNEQSAREYDCETCRDDPVECAKVPGLRHCEKAQRGDKRG